MTQNDINFKIKLYTFDHDVSAMYPHAASFWCQLIENLSLILFIFTEMAVICVFVFSFFTSSRRERSSGILKTGAWTRTKLNMRCDCVWRSNVRAERCASGCIMYNFKTFWIPTGEESGAEALHHRVKQGVLHPVSVHQLRGHRGTGWCCSFSLWQHSHCVYMELFSCLHSGACHISVRVWFFWLHVQICDVLPQNPVLTLKWPPLAF